MQRQGGYLMTNREFLETNKHFKDACKEAGIPPTLRQASKFRRQLGIAYRHRKVGKEDQ